jgi:transcriptional regulator with XRE-family HTH domain
MRRGTPSAELFGMIIFVLRTVKSKKTMRQVSDIVGGFASTVSQVEKGQRALKEPKIEVWAEALEVNKDDFLELWFLSQGLIRSLGGERIFYTHYDVLVAQITMIMDRLVPDEMKQIHIPKIEKPTPIQRQRSKSFRKKELERLIYELSGSERTRVQGYIEAIIENRA